MARPSPDHQRPNGIKAPITGAGAINRLARYSKEIPVAVRAPITPGVYQNILDVSIDPSLESSRLAATWLGHATILLRVGDLWILTDPVMSHRIGLPLGPITFGLGRLTPPANLDRLPKPDVILISHAHFDHLDKPTLRRLAKPGTQVLTAAGTAALIPKGFGEVRELPWETEIELRGVKFRAVKPVHWGARLTLDRHRGYNSYIIDAPDRRVLFAGDTAYTDVYSQLRGKDRPLDLAIFGIGAYDPWIHAHANPEQVWDMYTQSGAKYLMPMHHSTFKLSDEPLDEPLKRLLTVAGNYQSRIVAHSLGQIWTDDLQGVESRTLATEHLQSPPQDSPTTNHTHGEPPSI